MDQWTPTTTPPGGGNLLRAARNPRNSQGQPPVSVVVVRETPPRPEKLSERTGPMLSASSRSNAFNTSPSFSSAFRLQPRGGKPIATPSPSSRGRKRDAQCLTTTPPSASLMSRNMPSPEMSQVANNSPDSTDIGYHPNWESPLSNTRHGGEQSGTVMMSCSPTRVESALQTLSIKSPRIARGPQGSTNSPFNVSATATRPGSSFILYTSSPMGASYVRPQMDSTRSPPTVFSASPSSVKSSPRFAPLTVLQKLDSEEAKTPTQRPPLHFRPSSLIKSLDSKQNMDGDNEEQLSNVSNPHFQEFSGRDGAMNTFTTNRTPTSKLATPVLLCSTPKGNSKKSTGISPSRTPSSAKRSPRTPLPRVKLTPKSQSSRENLIPMTADRDLDLLPNDFIFTRSSRPPLFIDDRKMKVEHKPKDEKPVNTLMDQSRALSPASPPQRKRSYLPIPDWCDTSVGQQTIGRLSLTLPGPSQMTPPHDTTMTEGLHVPEVETKSLLTPSRSGSMFEEMMKVEDRAAAMDADGSLSDPDDDTFFVLTNPATLVEERQCHGRARQRQRLSYNSLDQSVVRQSSTSLALSTQASNTSLLGMAFIQQGDSSSSLIPREMTPTSTLPAEMKKRDHSTLENVNELVDDTSNILTRHKSEDSLLSVGLALEEPAPQNKQDEGRDLATPPAIAPSCSSPPPLSGGNDIAKTTPTNSVYLSRADSHAVNLTIARMVFNANKSRSPGMECS